MALPSEQHSYYELENLFQSEMEKYESSPQALEKALRNRMTGFGVNQYRYVTFLLSVLQLELDQKSERGRRRSERVNGFQNQAPSEDWDREKRGITKATTVNNARR